jgi:hypothetical protein
MGVIKIPACLQGGKVVGKVEGADPAALTDLVVAQAGSGAAAAAGKQQNGAAAAATAESQGRTKTIDARSLF